tara:strand:+ start:306 stop:665 length:360 start_codon:yes stop_codon:yes gene_type:complete
LLVAEALKKMLLALVTMEAHQVFQLYHLQVVVPEAVEQQQETLEVLVVVPEVEIHLELQEQQVILLQYLPHKVVMVAEEVDQHHQTSVEVAVVEQLVMVVMQNLVVVQVVRAVEMVEPH